MRSALASHARATTPRPRARLLAVSNPDTIDRNLTRVQQHRFTDGTAGSHRAPARGRGRSMDTREARTLTAATAVMCRMPACPATRGPLA